MDIASSVCFTGHRAHHLGINEKSDRKRFLNLLKKLEEKICFLHRYFGFTDFISGMALGVDTYAAQTVLRLRDYGMNIRLICAIPCRNQSSLWNDSQRKTYNEILAAADKVILLEEEYSDGCMQRRNEFMVNNSSLVLAVWNGKPGGTANTLRYARKLSRPILQIDPNEI